jgi:putative DNA primase/helicase
MGGSGRNKPDNPFFTDDGKFIAKWLADDIMNQHHFATHEQSDEIYVYKDGVYVPNGEKTVKKAAKKRLGNDFKTHYINEALEAIRIDNYVPYHKFENPHDCIAVENGLLNIKKEELKPFNPEYIHLTKIPVKYDPDADCPKIKEFIGQIVHEQDIKLIQEMFGYCLLKEYPLAKAFMLLGSGANGKSTLLNLLEQFLGEDNVANPSLQNLLDNRFAAVDLFGSLANIHADLSNKKLENTGTFKMLTGSDAIRGERKHKDAFKFHNHAKLIYSANELPRTDDRTEAFFRRWVIIEFPHQFLEDDPDTDPHILDKITTPEEMSGLLNWAVEGLQRVLQQGHFSMTESRKEIQQKWLMQTASLRAFVDIHCEFIRGCYISKESFYDAYREFCNKHDIYCCKKGEVTRKLPSMKPIVQKYRPELRVNGKKKRVRCWKNIKLKDDSLQAEFLSMTEIVQSDNTINSVMSNMSKEYQLSLACSAQENNKDSRKRLDMTDTDKQAETCEESKFRKIIHDILAKQKEPYEWHIDEIADELELEEHSDIKYLKEVMEEIAMNQDSPIVSTTPNYTKYVYKERDC